MLVKALLLVLGGIVAFNLVTIAGLAVSEIRDRRRRGLEVRYLQALWHVDRPPLFRSHVGASMARRPFRPWGGKPLGIALIAVTVFAGTALATGTGARRVATAVLHSMAQELGLQPAETEVSVAAPPSVDVASSHVPDGAARGNHPSPTGEPSAGSRGDPGPSSAAAAGSGSGTPSATAPPSDPPPGTTTPPPVLEAPGTLVALVVSSTRIDLDWADVAGETGYEIRRSTGSGWEPITRTAADVSAYSDGGLAPGTAYSYVVVAIYGAVESAPSDQASETTLVDPPAPTTLDALAVSPNEVRLSWAGVATATGFRIERSLDGEAWTTVAAVGGDVTSYADTGLTPGTTYRYRVVATNDAGDSPDSNEAQVQTPSDVPASSETPDP